MRRMRTISFFCVLGSFLAGPAFGAMIAGSTDAAKAAVAAKFHDHGRYKEYAPALTPESRRKDDRTAADGQSRNMDNMNGHARR